MTLTKIAVRSALSKADVVPYCIVHIDSASNRIVGWLHENGVQVIPWRPAWEKNLTRKLDGMKDEKRFSHLFLSPESVVATYLRVDLPLIQELMQFEHVLYTDVDVYFRKPVSDSVVAQELPDTIRMGYEAQDIFPLNAGVILVSMPFLRDTYIRLLALLHSKP